MFDSQAENLGRTKNSLVSVQYNREKIMRYLEIGIRLAFLFSLSIAMPANAAEECSDSSLSASALQCGLDSTANTKDSHSLSGFTHMADSSERKSCLSDCGQVFNSCTTSRARDCGQEYKLCSWRC